MSPPSKKRKLWLQGGPVPRSTQQRWAQEEAAAQSGSSTSSDSDSESNDQDIGETNNGSGTVEAHNVEDGDQGNIDVVDNEIPRSDDSIHNSNSDGSESEGSESDDSGSSDTEDSTSGDESNHDINFEFMPETLYRDSKHSTGRAISLILDLYSKHAISKSCMKELVPLIHKLLPSGNLFPRSFHMLRKSVKPFIPAKSVVVHYVCEKCKTYLGKDGANQCSLCPNAQKIKFYELSLSEQMKYLFEKRNLADAIDNFKGHSKAADITNSDEYVKVKSVLPGQYVVRLLWNTDGVKPHKSGLGEFYPIICTVLDVAPQLRPMYTIIVGLWHHKKTPNLNMFLIPFVKNLKVLRERGVRWVHPQTNKVYESKVVAPVASVDGPVRADLQNVHRHSGEYSCNVCEIEGITLNLGPRSQKRVFPFPEQEDPLRTKESMKELGLKALTDRVIVKGVKGPSILDSIPECDISKCLVLDYLHLVLLGVVRQFFELWFTNSGTDWYVGGLNNLTNFLKNIKSLYEIPRSPTNAKWKMFKASTWRAWLLFISLPAMKGKLKDKYFQHWILFVKGMSLLLQEETSEEEFKLAEILLSLFVRDTQELYGLHAMSYNLHGILHLVLIARRWGNLWSNSTFNFESMNGFLMRLLHGTRTLAAELSDTLNLIMASKTLKFLMKAEAEKIGVLKTELLSPCCSFQPSNEEKIALATKFGTQNVPALQYFARASIKSKTCTSGLYSAEKATNNKTVCFLLDNTEAYGVVNFYFLNDRDMYALICKFNLGDEENTFKHDETGVKITHIIPIETTNDLVVVPLCDICYKVFRVCDFVCEDVNRYEQKL